MIILVSPVGNKLHQSNECDQTEGWNTSHEGRQKPPEKYKLST